MQGEFNTISDISDFLYSFNFDNVAIIQVVRTCYFTREERRLFDYYPMYISGRNQDEIGLEVDKNQPKVSYYFKNCKLKLQFFQNKFQKDSMRGYIDTVKTILNERQYNILNCLLAGKSAKQISSSFNCNKSNICQIRDTCLKNLSKKHLDTYKWVHSILSYIHNIK